MRKEQLECYASQLEIELNQIAFNEIKFREVYESLVVFQSFCDFNLFWLYSIEPEVILHINTIKWLLKNITIKRKLSEKELLNYDLIISLIEPTNIDEFKKYALKFTK